MQEIKPYIAKRSTRIHEACYNSTPEKIFPLLCPVLEYDWLEHWRCDLVHTESGVAEMDGIFITFFEPGQTDVWTVSRYEKNERIEFIIVNSRRVSRLAITLTANNDGTTNAQWKEVLTALTPEGEKALESYSEKEWMLRRENISMRLNYYLEHGTMYRDAEHH